jgi:hypothetical protein
MISFGIILCSTAVRQFIVYRGIVKILNFLPALVVEDYGMTSIYWAVLT